MSGADGPSVLLLLCKMVLMLWLCYAPIRTPLNHVVLSFDTITGLYNRSMFVTSSDSNGSTHSASFDTVSPFVLFGLVCLSASGASIRRSIVVINGDTRDTFVRGYANGPLCCLSGRA